MHKHKLKHTMSMPAKVISPYQLHYISSIQETMCGISEFYLIYLQTFLIQ